MYLEPPTKPLEMVMHPIVLLSITDHYARVAKGTTKRVVGTLLGEVQDGKMHVTSSFAVPFEEEPRDTSVWFFDHNYHENMSAMFKKVNAKEKIIGWYSTGPKIKPQDLQVNELFRKYTPEPVLVILEVGAGNTNDGKQLPMEAYYAVKEKTCDTMFNRTFKSIPSSFGSDEAEDVGVEHLLRDLRNASTSTLATKVSDKIQAMQVLIVRLKEVVSYLQGVAEGKYAYNTAIVERLQDVFNELPELGANPAMVTASAVETNDHFLGIYVGSMLRSILGLHNLVHNKIKNKGFYAEEAKKEADVKKKEEAEAKKKEKEDAEKAGGDGAAGDEKKK